MKTLAAVALLLFALSSFAEPAVSTITPASGSITGGTYVHIHGSDLQLVPLPCFPPCALLVTFGGVEATVVSDTADEIIVSTPPHAAGSVDVQVALATKGTVNIANGYRYEDPLPEDNVRFLVPIAVSAPGALGSNWVSELSITNTSSEPITIASTTIAPQTTAIVTLPNPNVGAFFNVPRRLAGSVTAGLRVHDTSRDSDSWGTDIPVVPETQFRPSIVLGHIPGDSRFRTLLRLYGYTSDFANATVAIRDDSTGALLSTQTIVLNNYAQRSIDPVPDHPRLRAEITTQIIGAPLQPPVPIWGFVAVTNNSTQQVTTITPSLIPTAGPVALRTGHWAGGSSGSGSCVDVSTTDVNVSMVCAIAHFPAPKTTNGRFEADGTIMITAGPSTGGPGAPAHFSGVLNGDDLALTITTKDSTPFTIHVTYGSTQPCPQLCA
jgi:hypothetical protein